MRRLIPVVLSVGLAAAVMSPLLRSPPRDSFPLSSYPMFSRRIEAVNGVSTIVGLTGDGSRKTLSPLVISGSDEVTQALVDVGLAVNTGDTATASLCEAAAARVTDEDVVTLEVITERYDAVEFFSGAKAPLATSVHATCRVP